MLKKLIAGLAVLLTAISVIHCTPKADVLLNGTDDLYYYYSLLPANVQTYLENIHCAVIIDGKQMRRVVVLNDSEYDVHAENVGLTKQMVDEAGFVCSSTIYLKEGYEATLLHEVGHVLANYKGNYNAWAETDAWKYIYEKEAMSLPMDAYSTSTPTEYLAESFSWYILYPGFLAEYAPMTWQYINAIVERT